MNHFLFYVRFNLGEGEDFESKFLNLKEMFLKMGFGVLAWVWGFGFFFFLTEQRGSLT